MGLRNTEYSVNKGIDVKQGFFFVVVEHDYFGNGRSSDLGDEVGLESGWRLD